MYHLTFCQTINFQAGTSMSSIKSKVSNLCSCEFPIYNKNIVGYSVSGGVNYMEKKYFNLSSNIGMISKGGRDFVNNEGETMKKYLFINYITINTSIDFKYPIADKFIPYLSFGPRFDISPFDPHYNNEYKMILFGLNLGGGIKYDLTKYQIGLRYDYYQNFTHLSNTIGIKRDQHAFDINMTFGYKLE
jgi:hypothetical protein